MTRKRNFQTSIYLALRRMGMLCKTPKPTPRKIYIQKTIQPDGRQIIYTEPLDSIPENPYSLQSEIGVFLADKKISKPGCKFDIASQQCICGNTTNEFLTLTCKI
jgi:hypothetical protein